MDKKEHIKQVAIEMIEASGLINLSRFDLCQCAGIPDGSFPHIMGCTFAEFIEELKPTVETVTVHQVVKARANPELRREQILDTAIDMARGIGYHKLTRDSLAGRVGVSMGLINRYFGTMLKLRRDIMRAAVKREIPEIIAQGLVNGDKHARKASQRLKDKAAAIISGM